MESQIQPSIDDIIQEIGPLQRDDWDDAVCPPFDDDLANEIWIRKRVVLLRKVFEQHPSHDAALSCVYQCHMHEMEQPLLFARIQDDLEERTFKSTGLYREPDWDNEDYTRDWRQARDALRDVQEVRATKIISEYPDLGISEWAHWFLIHECAIDTIGFCVRAPNVNAETFEKLFSLVRDFVEYRKLANSSIEPSPGYFKFRLRRCASFLIRAVHCMELQDSVVQLSLFRRVQDLLPDEESVRAFARGLQSVGKSFELDFDDLVTGKHVNVKDYRGRVLLIDFWATWCDPCIESFPRLKELLTQHEGNVNMIGISCDLTPSAEVAKRRVLACLNKHEINWPVVISPRFQRHWGVQGIPTIFAIDRRGILRSTNAQRNLPEVVEELLNEA